MKELEELINFDIRTRTSYDLFVTEIFFVTDFQKKAASSGKNELS